MAGNQSKGQDSAELHAVHNTTDFFPGQTSASSSPFGRLAGGSAPGLSRRRRTLANSATGKGENGVSAQETAAMGRSQRVAPAA